MEEGGRTKMSWKFWKNSQSVKGKEERLPGMKEERLPGMKDIPELVGRQLVVELKQDPDWVWHLKSVTRKRSDDKESYDFRVFDLPQVLAKKVHVRDYNSLNDHPALILFEGWFNKKLSKVHFEKKMEEPSKAA
jgi:hypothetical protein